MELARPQWLANLGAWWEPVVGAAASQVVPEGIDARGRLHVECSSIVWARQARLLGDHWLHRLNARLPDENRFSALVADSSSSVMPQPVLEQWPRLLGEALAGLVRPVGLNDWGQELLTEAVSAQARDEFATRVPDLLTQICELLGAHCTISRIPASDLPSVWVLVASTRRFTDRRAVEDVLMDTWHDATQTFGPEHQLCLMHGAETLVDEVVEDWVASVAEQWPGMPKVATLARQADTNRYGSDAFRLRDEALAEDDATLCLAFAADTEERIRLAGLADRKGIPVRRHIQAGAETVVRALDSSANAVTARTEQGADTVSFRQRLV
ncbi:DciA family protein [Streptomyces triculaminicus]|uniref:DciA family protein n=1 Tax=Streptomyces triculaminicus TaxID=2816232 RepID=UPI0037D75769